MSRDLKDDPPHSDDRDPAQPHPIAVVDRDPVARALPLYEDRIRIARTKRRLGTSLILGGTASLGTSIWALSGLVATSGSLWGWASLAVLGAGSYWLTTGTSEASDPVG